MNKPTRRFPFKIILSYLVLGAMAVVASYFIYQQYTAYLENNTQDPEDKKIIETGELINLLFETDSFSRLALLTQKKEDFEIYTAKADSLQDKIVSIRSIITDTLQKKQLDSVGYFLNEKYRNIEQLRVLKLTRNENAPLDDILKEFKKLDNRIGMITVENFVKNSTRLNTREYNAVKAYLDYLNENSGVDTTKVSTITVDSMLAASRFIVTEAKKQNSRLRRSLQLKENELIQNDLDISSKLQQIISSFDAEVIRNNFIENTEKAAAVENTSKIVKWFGVSGFCLLLLFSYIVISDFFKAEKLKKRLQREKQYSEALLRSRDQLISTVSHDLKTPLNTIVGYSELFTHTALTEKQRSYTRQIGSSAHFISKLVDDLLDYSKLEAGKLTFDVVPFSLESLLQTITDSAKDIHADRPIDLSLYVDEPLQDCLFESDPLRIQQVINNLVSNAFKFTKKGRIQITANLLEKQKGKYLVEIAVTDTGIGISEASKNEIFKEFTQAEADTFQKFGGSGLGLAISKKITRLLKGTLEVESKLDEGSTFFFTIPLVTSEVTALPKTVHPLKAKNTLRAVVLDDDSSMIALLKELFEQMNIETKTYSDFYAFENANSFPFDFIITDIQMPGVNGFEVLEYLQQKKITSFAQQPVIAMTGNRDFHRNHFLEKGFTEVLWKPFSKDQLLAALSPLFLHKIELDLVNIKKGSSNKASSDVYDLAALRSFLGSDEGLNDVFSVFYTETEKDLAFLEKAIAEGNFDAIRSKSHKMLTMCRQLKAQQVVPILETLELTEEEDGIETVKTCFKALIQKTDTLIDALKNHASS